MTKKQKKLFYKTIFILGLASIIWEIKIFRQTIIDFKILIAIILIFGISTTLLSLNDFQKLFKYNRKTSLYFWTFIQSTASWGFLACSIFMFTNYYLAQNELNKETYEIIERSSMAGRKYHLEERKPTFKIRYDGKLKELVFPNKYYNKIESYKNIELITKNGFLGFDIIIEQKLL